MLNIFKRYECFKTLFFYKIQTCYWQFEICRVIQQLCHFYKAVEQLNSFNKNTSLSELRLILKIGTELNI
jgi:hypothetical protein